MANNVVDELQIKIGANASGVSRSLGAIKTKLEGIRDAASNLSTTTSNLAQFSIAMHRLSRIDLSNLRTQVSTLKQLSKLNFKNLSKPINIEINDDQLNQAKDKIKALDDVMSQISTKGIKESGMTPFVNSVRRLSEVDLSKFDTNTFNDIATGINNIASIQDISDKVNRLVSSLARLANAGDKTKTTEKNLPALGQAIREVADGLTSAGGIPNEINAFVGSLASLANAGNKTGTTATQLEGLSQALVAFFGTMQQAPVVSENALRMTEALGQLASAGSKTGAATKTVTASINKIGSARLDGIKGAIKDLGNILDKVAGKAKTAALKIYNSLKKIGTARPSIQSTTNAIRTMIGAMIGFRGITGFANIIKETIELGANLTEIDHIIESVFGDNAEYVDRWAKNAITQFGIAEHSAKQYAGVLSSMFQASQIGYKDAGKMAMDLVELAGDLSAFYNIDTETAYNKIRSGMAGMVRPLRDLGIDLTAATLEEFRLAQGIQTAYSEMTQAEKVMLRYQYLMSVTTTQQGDFQRTNKSLANSLRTLQAYIQAVGTQLGAGLGAAIRHVVVWLNEMMKYVLKAASAFKVFMETIFGKYKGGASGIAVEGLGDAVDDVDSLASGAGNAADGLGSASDAAKQLKKDLSVLPFDELNQLNKDRESASSGSGGGGVGGGGVGGGLIDGLLDWDNMLDESPLGKLPDWFSRWAKAIKDAVKAGDFNKAGKIIAEGLNKGIDKLYDMLDPAKAKAKIYPFIDAITTTFNSIVGNLHWEKLGRTLGRAINIVVGSLNRIIEGIEWKSLGAQLARGLYGLIDEVDFRDIGNLIGNKIMIIWNILNGFVHEFPWDVLGQNIGDLINGLFDKVDFETIADTLATGLNGLFTALDETAETIEWGDIADNIVNGITKFIKTFQWKKNGKALGKFLDNLCDAIIDVIDRTNWTELGQGIADFLAEIPWGKMLKVVGKAIIDALGGVLVGMASEPAGRFGIAVVGFLAAYKFSGSPVMSFVNNLVQAITGTNATGLLRSGLTSMFTSGFSGIALPLAAVSAGFFAAYEGITKWEEGIASSIESAEGLNGVLTEMGTVTDHVAAILENSGVITADQARQLVELNDAAENAGMSSEEFGALYVQALSDMGVSSEELGGVLEGMTGTAYGSMDAFWDLKAAAEGADSGLSISAQGIQGSISTIKSSVQNGVDAINKKWDDNETKVQEVAAQQSKDLEDWQNNVSTFRENMIQHLSQVGVAWGNVDIEQGDALGQLTTNLESANADMETAITNMEILNNSGLDKATVQAILNQIDPSSQAMSELIAHMDADDPTWQQFYDNLQQHLELSDTIQQAVDGMSEEYAKAIAPEFVEIGDNFEVEAGKISGFMIKGLRDGVFESTDEAVDAMRKVATAMQDGFKAEDQINSPSKVYENFAKHDIQGFVFGVIENRHRAVEAMQKVADEAQKPFDPMPEAMKNKATDIGVSFSDGLRAAFAGASQIVIDMLGDIKEVFRGISLYNEGLDLAQSLANGFSSVYIPTPHLYVAGYNIIDLGDGAYSYYPSFAVSWYRKGGLFSGGKGSLIGIAEDNRDEAVLPLEDRRAMARIGSAIADAGGSNGISDEAVDKLAGAIAEIMMNTQNNNNDQMNYIELKVEEEVLARAVTRGQQKLDYRNNPTPQMA